MTVLIPRLLGFERDYLGWNFVTRRGFTFGFSWMHCNGESTRTTAVLASYHHPASITWRWSLSWSRPRVWFRWPAYSFHRTPNGYNSYSVGLPLVGGFMLSTQPHMWRRS